MNLINNKFLKRCCAAFMCLCMVVLNMNVDVFAKTKANDLIETMIPSDAVGTGSEASQLNKIYYMGDGHWEGGPNPACKISGKEYYTRAAHTGEPHFSFKFSGTKFELYAIKDPNHGLLDIEVDGVKVGQANYYAANRASESSLIYSKEGLADGEHVVKATLLTTKPDGGTRENPDAHLDAIKVYSPPKSATGISITDANFSLPAGSTKKITTVLAPVGAVVDEITYTSSNSAVASISDNGTVSAYKNGTTEIQAKITGTSIVSNKVTVTVTGNDTENFVEIVDDSNVSSMGLKFNYFNSWGTDNGINELHDGTAHWSTKGQYGSGVAAAELVFYGNAFEIYGNKDSGNAIYNIILDGEAIGEADAYVAGGRQYKQLLFSKDNLAEKEHTLRVETSGRKNPAAGDSMEISIDFAKVYRTTEKIEATDFDIVNRRFKIEENDTKTIETTFMPSYATEKVITWKSSDKSIATVDDKGVVTAKKIGKTEIIGTLANGVEKISEIEVISGDYTIRAMFGNTDTHYLQKDYTKIKQSYGDDSTKYNSNFGWKGDLLNAELVTWTKNNAVSNLTITATDFENENKTNFSHDNISIQFLKTTSVGDGRAGNIPASPHTDVPDIIYGGTIETLAEQHIQSAWVTITIPENTPTGIYKGNLLVKVDEISEPIEIPYEFKVANLYQPEYKDYEGGVEIWQYPYAVAKYYNIPDEDLFKEKHLKLLEQNIEQYKGAGGNVITTAITDYPWDRNNPYDYPTTIKWTKELDGTFSFDFSQFDAWVGLNVKHGINDKLKCFGLSSYYGVNSGRKMRYFDAKTNAYVEEQGIEVGSTKWEEYYGQFLNAIVPHLDQKGWFDMTYMAMDEVGADHINAIADLVEKHPNKDGKHLKVSAAVNYGNLNQETLDRIHDISISLNHVNDEMKAAAADRRSKGLYTSFYTCTGIYPNSFGLSEPGESAWTMWYTAAGDMDGYLRWAGDNWLKDPYTNLDWTSWESGDTMLFYPDDNKNGENPQVRSTPRWEKMKEGKRDVEKMYFLRTNYPELTDEINNVLHSLGRKDGATNAHGGMYADSQETKDFIESEVVRMRNNLKTLSEKAEKLEQNKTAQITVSTSESSAGRVFIGDSSEVSTIVNKNTSVTVKAIANEGYSFVNWQTSDGTFLSEAPNYTFTVTENKDLVAVFKKDIVSLDTLKEAIKDAQEMLSNIENYIPNSVKGLDDALKAAILVRDNPSVDEVSAKKALDVLHDIMSKAVMKPNKINLSKIIDESDAIDLSLYLNGDEKQAFISALEDAKLVYQNQNATQKQVGDVITTLKLAKDGLKLLTLDKNKLETLINSVEKLKKDDYTSESWMKLTAELSKANDALKNAKTQRELDDARSSLQAKIEALMKVAPIPDSKPNEKHENSDGTSSPNTGDSSNLVMLFSLVMIGMGSLIMIKKRKKEN